MAVKKDDTLISTSDKSKVMRVFSKAGFTGNFLLNTHYGLGGFKQYEGRYKKNYWQGYSLNLGLGGDHKIFKKIKATSRVSYSVVNTVRDDEYLFSQDEYSIALPHKYLSLSVGLRIPL